MFRFAYAKTGNRPDAEALTSQVFLRAMPFLRSAAPEAARAHLFATARTEVANYWRERYGVAIDATRDPATPFDADMPAGADTRRIAQLLTRLPDQDRCVLELRFIRGLSVRDTASEMGISRGAARMMQVQALRRVAALGADSPR